MLIFFFFQAEDGIRDTSVTGVQTCALPISCGGSASSAWKTNCCAPGSSVPALWPAGGRGDGGGGLAGHRPPLRRRPRLPGLGAAALLVLRRSPLGGGHRRDAGGPGKPARAEARGAGRGAAGGD